MFPSANCPTALNCAWTVAGTLTIAGVTWIDVSADDSTAKLAVPLSAPDFAVIVTTPADCPIATPAEFTVATFVSEEAQLTPEVRACLLPSLNVPVAANCSDEPGVTSPELGLNVIFTSVAVLTLSCADPVADAPAKLKPALMVAVPELNAVAVPNVPDALPTVATAVFVELQAQLMVRSWVEESSNTPVAVKWAWPPTGIVTTDGEREMDTIFAAVTVNGTDCVADPSVAVIVTNPGARATTKPLLAPIFTTLGSDTDQVA